MKTKNTRVRLRDIKQGVTVYAANPTVGYIEQHFITSRPYMNKRVNSHFVESKSCTPHGNKWVF